MKIRTVLSLMLGAIVVAVLSILYTSNRNSLDQPIFFGSGLSMPAWLCFLLVSGVSMLVPLLFGVLRDLRRMVGGLTARRRLKSQQEAEERYLLGIESMLNGREERALEHFTAVLGLDPDHFEALLRAGEVLRTLRRYAEAIEYHRRAARTKEGDLRPLYSLVADYEESGAIENAKGVLNRIIDLNPKRSLNAYRKFRVLYMNEGAWDRAWEIQQKIEGQLSEMGRSTRSEKKYHLGIRYRLAQGLSDQGKERDAIGILRRLVRMEPSFVPAHLRLGKALAAIEQPEEAVEVWEEGYRATGHPIFLTTIEDHYLKDEQPRKAIEAMKAALWKSKKDIIPRFFLGKLYYRLEMIDEALQQFSLMSGQVTHFPALHYHLAKIMERHGNFREALKELEIVLQETELLKVEYICGTCARKFPAWIDYCDRCGEWNSVGIDFREERPVEELGLPTAPVYTVESKEG
ncbi:MAG TPA: tetratricopeptide repeat protein [Candidatus Polarisedimenticolia bacterium]|nr:tetratricopeptide repeat protein [Candidatus Polarisedimenticolia bacterium]